MKTLLKATFEHNLTMIVFKTDHDMMRYDLSYISTKKSADFYTFNITKDLPDYYFEIPQHSRFQQSTIMDTKLKIIKKKNLNAIFKHY